MEIDARYSGYLERQERDIASFRRDEALLLPADLDYSAVGSLSREISGKLAASNPPPTSTNNASNIPLPLPRNPQPLGRPKKNYA